MFWFPLQLMAETFLILRRTERDMIKNVYWFSCKVPVILVLFERKLNFLNSFSNNTHIKFHEIPSGGSRVFPGGQTDRRTDGRTDMTNLNDCFSQFCERAKNEFLEWMLWNAVTVLISFDVEVSNVLGNLTSNVWWTVRKGRKKCTYFKLRSCELAVST